MELGGPQIKSKETTNKTTTRYKMVDCPRAMKKMDASQFACDGRCQVTGSVMVSLILISNQSPIHWLLTVCDLFGVALCSLPVVASFTNRPEAVDHEDNYM